MYYLIYVLPHYVLPHLQGHWKLFITDQSKFNPQGYSLSAWVGENFTTANILLYQLYTVM